MATLVSIYVYWLLTQRTHQIISPRRNYCSNMHAAICTKSCLICAGIHCTRSYVWSIVIFGVWYLPYPVFVGRAYKYFLLASKCTFLFSSCPYGVSRKDKGLRLVIHIMKISFTRGAVIVGYGQFALCIKRTVCHWRLPQVCNYRPALLPCTAFDFITEHQRRQFFTVPSCLNSAVNVPVPVYVCTHATRSLCTSFGFGVTRMFF